MTVQFGIELEKPSSLVVGTANLKVLTKTTSSSSPYTEDSQQVQETFWSTGDPQFYNASKSITLYASDFNTSGGEFYVEFAGYESCKYSIVKDELPTFTLSPTSVSLSCGNTDSRTFTVTPANIPSGANVTYQWSYNGWIPGNSTTTSRTLQPSSGTNLPSNVSVTPFINGVAQVTQTSTVSRSSFNPTIYQITGDSYVCDTGIYTISDLPNYLSVQSASSSDTNIATVSVVNDQITVTKVSDGLVTITATIQNACGQSVTRTKNNIQVGIPDSANNAVLKGASAVCGTQYYTYTLSGGANHPCINSVNWSVSSQNLEIVSQNSNSVTVKKKLFITQNAGLITASIVGTDIEIKKGVWVGLPNNASLNIQKIGSYDLYAGQWTKLKANYTPLQYKENEPFNYTFDWQIPNSQIRNYADTAYKDVRPNSAGQLNIGVRVLCDCGYGPYEYRMFNVYSSGGGFQFN